MTTSGMSGILPDMKKVNAREFQKAFSKVAQQLGRGETVEVTRRGKPFGFFTRVPERAPKTMPNFAANLAKLPLVGPAGEEMIAMTLDEPVS